MKLYFSWIDEDEIYDPSYHRQHQEEIFSFILSERESEFPLVTIEIKNPRGHFHELDSKQWCFISIELQGKMYLLFKGRLCPLPHSLMRETIKLNFVAQPSNWQDKLQEFHHQLKLTSSWDPLFVRPEEQDNPQESLETRSELFYWCRTTGRLSLSNIFWGSQQVDLGENHFYDSLNFKMGEPPLESVHVILSAQWVQKYLGQTNLTPFITSCFEEGIVNTLTGNDLEAKWWSVHEKIGQSGYWVSQSSIQEIKPARTGPLNLYPSHSSQIWISPDDPAYGAYKPDHPQQKSLKRSWYKINLRVGWHYQRKRSERVEFTLKQNLQMSISSQNRRCIKLHLEDMTQGFDVPSWQPEWNYSPGFQVLYQNSLYTNLVRHQSKENFEQTSSYWQQEPKDESFVIKGSQGHFFSTDRGHQAIQHAIEIARAHLAISARALEVTIAGSFEHFALLTCDHSVQIRDHRLPGKSIFGKIKALKLYLDGESGRQWGELTLGVSIGCVSHEHQNSSSQILDSSSYSLDYADAHYSADHLVKMTSSGIAYHLQLPSNDDDKWLYPEAMTGQDIVENVTVEAKAREQNDYLLRHQYPNRHSIQQTLKEIPTQIHIQLADLRSWKTQKMREFKVIFMHPWSAPQQIK